MAAPFQLPPRSFDYFALKAALEDAIAGPADTIAGRYLAAALATIGVSTLPSNLTKPSVSGVGSVGEIAECAIGSWANPPHSFAFQWIRGAADIPGATAATYRFVAADGTTKVGCRVIATNSTGSISELSSNTITVAAATPAPNGVPVSGAAGFPAEITRTELQAV